MRPTTDLTLMLTNVSVKKKIKKNVSRQGGCPAFVSRKEKNSVVDDSTNPIAQVAEILARGILRRRLRDVRKPCKNKRTTEKSLDGATDKSVHRFEPYSEGESE